MRISRPGLKPCAVFSDGGDKARIDHEDEMHDLHAKAFDIWESASAVVLKIVGIKSRNCCQLL